MLSRIQRFDCWLLSTCLMFSSAVAAVEQRVPTAADRPNIILMMTDDQGCGDLGIVGNPVLETPNLDGLARQSALMTTFYVSPVCAPTRACLMTGRYNYRTRVVDTFMGRAMMEPGEVTIAEVLREAGYRTGIFGKWHLGDCYPMRPIDQGFEEALVHRGGGLAQPSEPIANARRYTDPILIHNGEEVRMTGYCTDVYFDAAMRFIDEARASERPFFVYLPPNAPHGPFHDVPEALYQKYRSRDLSSVMVGEDGRPDVVARVFAMIENIDQNVGRLLRKLELEGLEENTIVIFMVDNGPNTRRYVGPYRGMKTEVHEGGVRSPFYMRWPARLQAGQSSDRLTAHIDVMPTLLEAAGVAAPAGVRLDGRSFLPLLEGKDVEWGDRTLVIQSHRGNVPQRYHHFQIRDERWKLVHPSGFGRYEMPEPIRMELYDLVKDPGERSNVAESRPEIVARLKRSYDDWYADVSATRKDNYAPPRIVVGTDHETRTVLTWEDWRVSENVGWGRQGKWLLEFVGEHTYDIELCWPEKVPAGTVQVRVGDVELEETQSQPFDEVLIKGARIPSGLAELSARVESDDQTTEVYHVILHRRRE